MPHASIVSKTAAGYQSDGGEKTKRQRNKLKKRAPFGYSETNYVSYDLSNLMGNHHSIEVVPRPTRPPRPSTTDLPDLPGLPIYKTFGNELKPATTLSHEPPPPFQEQQPSESATAWVRAQSDSTPVPTSASRPSHLERRTHPSVRSTGRHEAGLDRPPVPVPQRPPQYDRASRLAESYQSLLPDFDSLEYPESHTALHRQKSDLRHGGSNREQWHYKHNPRNSGHLAHLLRFTRCDTLRPVPEPPQDLQ
ncbi:hypothetical protein V8F33_010176 [Rhypophila sp. PSN 637]